MRWIPLPLIVVASAAIAADSPLRPEQMREAMALNLGEWRSVSTLVELEFEPGPGEDPALARRAREALRAQVTKPTTQKQCLWDDGTRMYIPGVHVPADCDFSRLEARDGKFAFAGTCRDPASPAPIDVTAEGTYTSKRMTYRSQAIAAAGKGRVRMTMSIVSRFKGKCDSIPVVMLPSTKDD